MAYDGNLFHSTPSQLDPVLPQGWQAWGENVGYATGSEDCGWLFEGFWESPNHRANLLNPIFDTAGIGVIVDGTDVTTDAVHPVAGETVAAGIDPACDGGCSQTKVYAMFLMAVAIIGGAISWWAFRS
jgi:hypothetical protein